MRYCLHCQIHACSRCCFQYCYSPLLRCYQEAMLFPPHRHLRFESLLRTKAEEEEDDEEEEELVKNRSADRRKQNAKCQSGKSNVKILPAVGSPRLAPFPCDRRSWGTRRSGRALRDPQHGVSPPRFIPDPSSVRVWGSSHLSDSCLTTYIKHN